MRVEDMSQKMLRMFEATDENFKDIRSDLYDIGQKVDELAVKKKAS